MGCPLLHVFFQVKGNCLKALMPRFCDRIYVLSVGVISADDIFGPWAFRKA